MCAFSYHLPHVVVASLLLLLVLSISTSLVSANFGISLSNDIRKTIELGTFGYATGGSLSIQIKKFGIKGFSDTATTPVPPQIGFAVDTVDTAQTARSERDYSKTEKPCFVDDASLRPQPPNGARVLFWLNGSTISEINSNSKNKNIFTTTLDKRGLYSIFFFNCLAGAERSLAAPALTLSVHIEQYNVDSVGQKNYLTLGDQPSGTVHLVFCFFYLGLVLLWRKLLNTKSQYAKRVHQVVLFLLFVKFASLLFEAFKFYHYARTGEPNMWDFFYYVFLTLKGISLFAAIILLGSGWSSAKAFLSENDKTLLLILLPAQVFINISIAILEETSEGNWWWMKLLDVLRILDVICLLLVLLPLVWSMKNLRDAAEQEEKAAVNLQRMKVFRTFYLVVVGYIYATRVILIVVVASLPFYMLWVAHIFREACAAALYSYIVYAFQPGPAANPYEAIDPNEVASVFETEPKTAEQQQEKSIAQEMEERQELEAPEEVVAK